MKLVIQRVNHAMVTIQGEEEPTGEIDKGLFVLVGVGDKDNIQVVDKLAEQLSKLRIMSDDEDKMNLSVKDVNASVLVVSQFTLYGDTSKGNRPSFIKAADPKMAEELYKYFIEKLEQLGVKTESGSFGDYMLINAEMDGPVTILMEDKK